MFVSCILIYAVVTYLKHRNAVLCGFHSLKTIFLLELFRRLLTEQIWYQTTHVIFDKLFRAQVRRFPGFYAVFDSRLTLTFSPVQFDSALSDMKNKIFVKYFYLLQICRMSPVLAARVLLQ